MKKIFILILSSHSLFLKAQNVGIGTPNPQNKLHVAGGFRLDTLTGVNGAGLVRHDANGVVYGIKFSGNSSDVLRGDGTFGNYDVNGSIGWLLNGNSGTNAATNFLGTIDNVPFNIRVNNLRSGLIDPASGNTSWGYQTLFSNTTGLRNTAIGKDALSSNLVGSDNTAIGHNALLQNIGGTGFFSVPLGVQNTAIGSDALRSNTLGRENTATGYRALVSVQTASNNSAYGSFALESNLGTSNNAFGSAALRHNTTGGENCAFGSLALSFNSTGYSNTAMGVSSLYFNNGYYNSALGAYSLFENTSGHDNTALGYFALARNTIASFNTAVGAFSLYNNISGSLNVAVGYKSLEQNSSGIWNTAIGFGALQGNTQSSGNTAVGTNALLNHSGSLGQNSAFGYRALASNTSGYGNTAIGNQAAQNNVSGRYNTAIGFVTAAALPNNVENTICIGYNTGWATTQSNHVNIGNFSVTWIGGQVGWFHYSDKRIKNDIKDDVPGLSFITRLKPVTYHVDVRKQDEIANAGKKIDPELSKEAQKNWEGKYDVEKIRMTGFFAQDVEESAKAINYSFSGVHNPKNGGLYSLDYSAFVVPLVKAVQEQQSIIEKQQKLIDELLKRVEALEKK